MGSDQWSRGLLIFAAILLGYQIIVGWRRGLVRQLFNLFSIASSYLAGFYGAKYAVPFFRPMGYPDFVISGLLGGVIAMIVYFVLSTIGSLVLKKTSQQSVGLIRFFYGLSGALIGVGVGIFFIWMALLGLRLLGTIAESEIHAQSALKGEKRELPGLIYWLVGMKHSMDESALGSMLARIDPIPLTVYSTLGKVAQLVSTPDATERFVKYPGTKSLLDQPVMMDLAKDPDIIVSVQKGDYLALMKNKHFVDAMNNPEVMELLKKFNLEKALNYALPPDGKKSGLAKP